MDQLTEARKILGEANNVRLLESWKKEISLCESAVGEMSLERKSLIAHGLENVNRQTALYEATQQSNVGPQKTFGLDLAMATLSNIIAPEIASTQAIDNTVGVINYFEYVYSNDKDNVKSGDVFNSPLGAGALDANYSKAISAPETIGAAGDTTISTVLAWTPITPGSLTITAGSVVGTDDGEGNITGTGITSGTIKYDDGTLNITLAAAATAEVYANYGYDNVTVPVNSVPEVELRIRKLPIVAEYRKLKANYGIDAAFQLNKEYGQDIDNLLSAQVAGEIAREIDAEICLDILKSATAYAPVVWSKTQAVGVTVAEQCQGFMLKVLEATQTVFQNNQKVEPNFMLAGTQVVAVLKMMGENFFAPVASTAVGPHMVGTLGGNIKVYVVPAYNPYEFVLGYKGQTFLDAAYVYAPYMPVIETSLVMMDDFMGRKGYATAYGKKVLNNKLLIKGRITA